jgi:hypothetical protein
MAPTVGFQVLLGQPLLHLMLELRFQQEFTHSIVASNESQVLFGKDMLTYFRT